VCKNVKTLTKFTFLLHFSASYVLFDWVILKDKLSLNLEGMLSIVFKITD